MFDSDKITPSITHISVKNIADSYKQTHFVVPTPYTKPLNPKFVSDNVFMYGRNTKLSYLHT